MPKTVSVIIATYNRFEALKQTLTDLRAQTHPPLEVLVVDQSRNESGHPADRRQELAEFEGLRYVHQAIPNAQTARNSGIVAARGEVVLLVDDDVRISPEFIANHLRNYELEPDLDGVSGQTLDPGQQPTDELPLAYSWPQYRLDVFAPQFQQKTTCYQFWPESCKGSVRRQTALSIGGFDEQFTRTWNDDTDFSWRLHTAGAKIVFDPRASLVHLEEFLGRRGNAPPARINTYYSIPNRGRFFSIYGVRNLGSCAHGGCRPLLCRHLCRKVFLRSPHSFLIACLNFIKGYQLASAKLRMGPRYIPASIASDASRLLQTD